MARVNILQIFLDLLCSSTDRARCGNFQCLFLRYHWILAGQVKDRIRATNDLWFILRWI